MEGALDMFFEIAGDYWKYLTKGTLLIRIIMGCFLPIAIPMSLMYKGFEFTIETLYKHLNQTQKNIENDNN